MSQNSRAHSRTRRACAQCKNRKIRCQPSTESPSTCYRCYHAGQECTFPEAKKRKRPVHLRARLDQLEETYGGILGLLSGRQKTEPSATSEPHQQSAAERTQSTPPSSSDRPTRSEPVTTGHGEPLLGVEDTQALLQYYRHVFHQSSRLSSLPKDQHLAHLRERKPCLLLAILAVSSWKQRALQLRLEDRFKQDFAFRYFVHHEQSLDMLQALVVYISWIHFTHAPLAVTHASRLLTSAITLVLDLGFDKPPSDTAELDANGQTHHVSESQSVRLWSKEARRAFVAVYMFAAMGPIALRKGTAMRYTDYVEECALSLAENPETEFDTRWPHYIRLSQIGLEIKDTFSWRQDAPFTTTDEELHMLVKSIEQKLNAWRASLPVGVDENPTLRIASSIRYAALYETGTYGILEGQLLSPIRIALIFKCLDSISQIVRTTLSQPTTLLEAWPALNWRHLKYSVMLGSKAALILDSFACDIESAARVIKLDLALEKLAAKVNDLQKTMCNDGPLESTHFYQQLLMEWQQLRRLYQPAKDRFAQLKPTLAGMPPEEPFASTYDCQHPVPAIMSDHGPMPAAQWSLLENMNDWTQEDFWLTAENCDVWTHAVV